MYRRHSCLKRVSLGVLNSRVAAGIAAACILGLFLTSLIWLPTQLEPVADLGDLRRDHNRLIHVQGDHSDEVDVNESDRIWSDVKALEICLMQEDRLIFLSYQSDRQIFAFATVSSDFSDVYKTLVQFCDLRPILDETRKTLARDSMDNLPSSFTAHKSIPDVVVQTTFIGKHGLNVTVLPIFQQRDVSYVVDDVKMGEWTSLFGLGTAMSAEEVLQRGGDPKVLILPHFTLQLCKVVVHMNCQFNTGNCVAVFSAIRTISYAGVGVAGPTLMFYLPCEPESHKYDDATIAESSFEHEATQLLRAAKKVLDALNIRYWINSGTLLGWLRQCGFIGHARDVDIGLYADDFDQERVEELITVMDKSGFRLSHRFGILTDSFELSFQTASGLKLDIFFFYIIDESSMYNGGTQARTGNKYKYLFPRFSFCWVQLAGLLVRVPCNTHKFVEANYGTEWRTPIDVWDWKKSPPNVSPNGEWNVKTWAKTIQCDVCVNKINLTYMFD